MSISKLLFGEIALKKKLVTQEKVEECLQIQKKLKDMGIVKTLGAIMHDKKYLSMVEIKQILREMTGTKDWNAIEGYEILDKLGQGGMGNVYKARNQRLGKLVAIKVLPPELAADPEYLDRFNREARAAAKLNHPNIVQAIDVGESYGYHYFVMEFVDGRTVKDMIERDGCLAEGKAIEVVVQVCEALIHAWKNDMIHRDIKPSNIIVTHDGIAKLCDLGLAKSVTEDAAITQTGVIMGTPFYLSPEQARSEDLDIRSDLYSLGVTFFHMVTGQVPFTGNSAATILYKHIFLEPPKPKSLNPSLTSELSQLIVKMLGKAREQRHENPEELRDELREILKTLPSPAAAEQAAADEGGGGGADSKAVAAERPGKTPLQETTSIPGGFASGQVANTLASTPAEGESGDGRGRESVTSTMTRGLAGPAGSISGATRTVADISLDRVRAAALAPGPDAMPALPPIPLAHRLIPLGLAAALALVAGLLYTWVAPVLPPSAETAVAEEYVALVAREALARADEATAAALKAAREHREKGQFGEAVLAYDEAARLAGRPGDAAVLAIRREQESLVATALAEYEKLKARYDQSLKAGKVEAKEEVEGKMKALQLGAGRRALESELERLERERQTGAGAAAAPAPAPEPASPASPPSEGR